MDIDTIISHPEIGKGAGRNVFQISDSVVVKVPRLLLGIKNPKRPSALNNQSIKELEIYQKCPERLKYLLCPILNHFYVDGCEIPVLFMQKLETFDSSYISQLKQQKKEYRKKKEKVVLLELLIKDMGQEDKYISILKDIIELCTKYNLQKNEVTENLRNIGYHIDEHGEKHIKILDYGYTG